MMVASSVPGKLANPPMITINKIGIKFKKVKDDGSIKVIYEANKEPATPAKNAEIRREMLFILPVFFPNDFAAKSSSLVASMALPKGELQTRCINKYEIIAIINTKIRKIEFSEKSMPKMFGLGIPGKPNGPLVNSVQFSNIEKTTNEKPSVTKAR